MQSWRISKNLPLSFESDPRSRSRSRRGYRIYWRGGGWRHSQAHTPLDIVRVTSSALRKIEKHPHSWTFTSTPPPLDIARVTSSTFQGGGGWSVPDTHTLHRFSVSGQVQEGGWSSLSPPPPPGSATEVLGLRILNRVPCRLKSDPHFTLLNQQGSPDPVVQANAARGQARLIGLVHVYHFGGGGGSP